MKAVSMNQWMRTWLERKPDLTLCQRSIPVAIVRLQKPSRRSNRRVHMRRALRGYLKTSDLVVRVANRHILVEVVGTDEAKHCFPQYLIVLPQS